MVSILNERGLAEHLETAEKRISSCSPQDVPKLFSSIPLDVFGLLLLDPPSVFPHLREFFPRMPPDSFQERWVGSSGVVLLRRSIAFVSSLVAGYERYVGKPLQDSTVLDYGCGWGRLLRLLYKYVPETQLFGVDAWPEILEIAHETGVRGNLAQIADYPETLPFNVKFDLIFAFSVFTHLSPRAQERALKLLSTSVTDNGLMVVTIRPGSYWITAGHKDAERLTIEHNSVGFAFSPHNRNPIDGDIPYGDTSITVGYIEREWRDWSLLETDYNSIDPEQILVFLRKRRS